MRLRNIYVLCRDNLHNVEAIDGVSVTGNSGYISVKGWTRFLKSYSELMSIEYTRGYVEGLIESVPEIYRHQDNFKITTTEWAKVKAAKEKLINSMIDVMRLYRSMGLDNDENTIGLDIKLPNCEDFSDFKKCVEELDFILYKCPLFKIDGEDLKFTTLDVGSFWLNFALAGLAVDGTSRILNNIAAFVDKCYVIKSHKMTVEQQKIQLEDMKMEHEAKKTILEGLEKLYNAQVDNAVTELGEKTGVQLKDGEEKGVVAQSIEKTNILIDKGLQIYSTIDSPKEVKALFDALEPKYLLQTEKIKLLETKENEEE